MSYEFHSHYKDTIAPNPFCEDSEKGMKTYEMKCMKMLYI